MEEDRMVFYNLASCALASEWAEDDYESRFWQNVDRGKVHVNNHWRFSKEMFPKIFYASPCGMFISHIKSGGLIEVNDAFCTTTGFSRELLIGGNMSFCRLWENDIEREVLLRQLVDKGSLINKEISFSDRDGKKHHCLLSTTILHLNDQICLLSIVNDISEHSKALGDEERTAEVHLVAELASSLAHEVRNPMTTVRGFLQMMSEKQPYELDYEDIGLMISEIDKANNIISEILALTREKDLDLQYRDLNLLLESLEPVLRAAAGQQQKHLVIDFMDVAPILMDEKEMGRLVSILVQNALEAMTPGQTLRLSLFRSKAETVFLGEGILVPDETDSFSNSTVEPQPFGNSTGWGNTLCHSIAARHHAILEINNTRQGEIFRLRFRK